MQCVGRNLEKRPPYESAGVGVKGFLCFPCLAGWHRDPPRGEERVYGMHHTLSHRPSLRTVSHWVSPLYHLYTEITRWASRLWSIETVEGSTQIVGGEGIR